MRLARVAQTPIHNGDGYGYGGDWILTIDKVALNLGPHGQMLVYEMATRWNDGEHTTTETVSAEGPLQAGASAPPPSSVIDTPSPQANEDG